MCKFPYFSLRRISKFQFSVCQILNSLNLHIMHYVKYGNFYILGVVCHTLYLLCKSPYSPLCQISKCSYPGCSMLKSFLLLVSLLAKLSAIKDGAWIPIGFRTQPHFQVERSDDRKYVCVRKLGY